MDLDRPHHRTTGSSELFICFTSRLSSSSSMKISKSILSPGRNRDQPMSLPTSLSRRLRTNGSIKGGQASPMFPSTNTSKKRGCAFENPEPSSPKVTCIGQVRVKTKKKAAAARKQTRSLSRRRSGSGGGGGGGAEVSFRKLEDGLGLKSEDKCGSFGQGSQRYAHPQQQQHQQQECLPHRNQRWVHLPLTICEALRAFGAEFSCLFPCKSWCFSTSEREKGEKGNGSGDGQQSSCGAVFARWLVTLQDGDGGKEREIELVVGEDEESTSSRSRSGSTRRRHVLEDFDVNGEIFEAKGQSGGGGREGEEKEDEARVSICIPPKNALLLMRCRSDPVKMAALNNRFWEAPTVVHDVEHEDEDDDEDLEKLKQVGVHECEDMDHVKLNFGSIDEEKNQMDVQVECIGKEEHNLEVKDRANDDKKAEMVEEKPESSDEAREEVEQVQEDVAQIAKEVDIAENSIQKKEEDNNEQMEGEEEEESLTRYSTSGLDEDDDEATRAVLLAVENALKEDMKAAETAEAESSSQETTTTTTQLDWETEDSGSSHCKEEDEDQETESRERKIEKQMEEEDEEKDSSVSVLSSSTSVLPDCLLLMMCEPKLSMEVSKETWVCRTDFIRCLPQRHNNKQVRPLAAEAMNDDVNNAVASDEKRVSIDSKLEHQGFLRLPPPALPPQLAVPPRSSCSLPAAAAVSMAAMIEQKLVNAVGYEPFVLTRCKSEPMRSAAKLAAPDACFWTKRKLEPLRRAAFHVGAAGVGF